jgi:hypothetical protein
MQDRVQSRQLGTLQGSYVARVAELNAILDNAHLEVTCSPKFSPAKA